MVMLQISTMSAFPPPPSNMSSFRDIQWAQACPHPLRQMGAKGKAKAKAQACIGKAKPKGKSKPKGKINVNGKADGQYQDQAQPQELVSSSGVGSRSGNGWNCIQPGQPIGKLGSQVVKYQLNAVVAIGPAKNTHLLKHCEWLTKYSNKPKFALRPET